MLEKNVHSSPLHLASNFKAILAAASTNKIRYTNLSRRSQRSTWNFKKGKQSTFQAITRGKDNGTHMLEHDISKSIANISFLPYLCVKNKYVSDKLDQGDNYLRLHEHRIIFFELIATNGN